MYNPGQEISSLDFGAIIGGSLNAVVKAQAQSAQTSVDFIRAVGFAPGKTDESGKVIGVGDPITVRFKYTKEVSPYVPGKVKAKTVRIDISGEGYSDICIAGLEIGSEKLEPGDYVMTFGDNGEILTVSLLKEVAAASGSKVSIQAVTPLPAGMIAPTVVAELVLVEKTSSGQPPVFQDMELNVPILTMMPIPFIRIEYADIDFNVKINSVSNTETKESSNSDVKSSSGFGYKGFGVNVNTSLNASFSNQKSSNSSEEVKKDFSLNIKVHATQDDMPAGVSRILDILEENIITRPSSAALPPAPPAKPVNTPAA